MGLRIRNWSFAFGKTPRRAPGCRASATAAPGLMANPPNGNRAFASGVCAKHKLRPSRKEFEEYGTHGKPGFLRLVRKKCVQIFKNFVMFYFCCV
jgi:hypothetical protein